MGTDIFIYILTGVVTVGATIVFLVPLLLWRPRARRGRRQGRTPRTPGRQAAPETAALVVSPLTVAEPRSSRSSSGTGTVVGRAERNTVSNLLFRIRGGLSSLGPRSDSGASADDAAGNEKPFWRRKRDLLRGMRAQRDPLADLGAPVSKPSSFTRERRPAPGPGLAASMVAEAALPEVPAPPGPESTGEAMPGLLVMEEQVPQPEPSPAGQSPAHAPETALDAPAEFAEMVQEWASSVGKLLEDLPASMEASDWTLPDAEPDSPRDANVDLGATEPTKDDAGSPLIPSEAESGDEDAHLTLSLPETDLQDLLDEVQSLMNDL